MVGHLRRRALLIFVIVACIIANITYFLPRRLHELIQPTVHAATFTVNTAADHDDATCDAGDCTLREAINAANAAVGADMISFSISGGGVHTINLNSALPSLTDPVTIDGTTQTGFSGTPLIELNGTGAGSANGLNFQSSSGGSIVKGLVINRFSLRGINADVNITVQGCFIGTNAAGTSAQGNGTGGLRVNAGGTIGGTTAAARNIISGNMGNGMDLVAGASTIQGNFIGTDVNGTADLGNTVNGILMQSSGNTLGGTAGGAGNLISANHRDGVQISGSNNQVQGNLVGTDVTGLNGLGNGTDSPGNYNGIYITFTSSNNVVGGTVAGARNILAGGLISNNGIRVEGSSNTVQGNYIGTDITGNASLGAYRSGMTIQGINNLIGGTTAAARNVVSGNGGGAGGLGIDICCGGQATGNMVQGNYIGLKADGTGALPNSGGVRIASGNRDNTIGGTTGGARNIISGNFGEGISLSETGTTHNLIQGNYIGLNPAGTAEFANQIGILIGHDATENTIGGTTSAARNVISGNSQADIEIFGSGANGNLIQGNFIGTQADGVSSVSNPGRGVYIASNPSNNTIGGTAAGAGNVIAFHSQGGVGIDSNAGTGNAVLGNSIYSNTNALGIDLKLDGVTANDACDADSGPNNLQNFPIITSVTADATNTTISGTLNSTASTQFRVELFSSASCDSSGNGQGQTFLGSVNANTDGSCAGSFMFVVANTAITGANITATATDPGNNTSEFSACVLDSAFVPKTLQFSSTNFPVGEGGGHVTITVTRAGDTSGTASVNYNTADTDTFSVNCSDKSGHAFGRCDFATVVGTLSWTAGDAAPKTFDVPIINDSYSEGTETFSVVLINPTGGTLGSPSTATVTISDNDNVDGPNPILQGDAAGVSFFVRQHYLDFLGREPEQGEPWSAILNGCADQFNTNPNSPSISCDRINVSGSFFGSPEFKVKGVYVIDFYRVAFDRLPTYTEFVFDLASVTGATAPDTNARRAAYANNFVLRNEFASLGGMSNTDYVMTLMSHSGQYNLASITTPDPANPDGPNKVTLTTNDLINALNGATLTRAQVLRAIVQSDEVTQNLETVNAFVASQYYGYLRRTPDAGGFNSWVTYLKNNPMDFRTMVHGFLDSIEYRLRFGPV